MLEFPRSHHFGLYEGMWLSLLSSDRSSFWHTSPRKEHADNDDNHYTLYIQHGDTHTEFQIKTANICFHFFCTKYKITMFPHFEHLKNSDQMSQKLDLILEVFQN